MSQREQVPFFKSTFPLFVAAAQVFAPHYFLGLVVNPEAVDRPLGRFYLHHIG